MPWAMAAALRLHEARPVRVPAQRGKLIGFGAHPHGTPHSKSPHTLQPARLPSRTAVRLPSTGRVSRILFIQMPLQ